MPLTVADIVVAFVAALPRGMQQGLQLHACVEAAWRRAREAHPECRVSPVTLFAYIGERLPEGDDAAVELGRRCVEDLYLACGCAQGDAVALATLEREVLHGVQRSLRLATDERGEVMQVLRERMLVGKAGRPGIAAYDGRAPLATWLRVCAVRLGRTHASRARRSVELEDALAQVAPGVPDPGLAYLKRLYGAQFHEAFGAAVASLTARERNLLRYSVADGFGIDQIAAIYHVHRATAARQLQQARRALAEATRQHMRRALGVSEAELESILRVLTSMTDAALQQVLARGPR